MGSGTVSLDDLEGRDSGDAMREFATVDERVPFAAKSGSPDRRELVAVMADDVVSGDFRP